MKLYNSIDEITVSIYDKILERKDLIYLVKKCDYYNFENLNSWEIGLNYQLKQTFGKIQDNFTDLMGLSEEYIDYMELERQLLILQCEHLISEDDIILNDIREIERQIKLIKPKKKKTTLTEELFQMSKYLGYEIDPENTSLYKFITTKKAFNLQLKKDAERSKKASQRK